MRNSKSVSIDTYPWQREAEMIAFIVEPMTARDVGSVSELERLCFPDDPWPAAVYREEALDGLHRLYFVVRARVDPKASSVLIGNGGCRIQEDAACITTIAIHPKWQGHGIGEWLLLNMLAAARRAGAKLAKLEVRESNTPALRLYRKHGFVVLGRHERYYGDEAALVLGLSSLDALELDLVLPRFSRRRLDRQERFRR